MTTQPLSHAESWKLLVTNTTYSAFDHNQSSKTSEAGKHCHPPYPLYILRSSGKEVKGRHSSSAQSIYLKTKGFSTLEMLPQCNCTAVLLQCKHYLH